MEEIGDISAFWRWFASVAEELSREFDNRALLDELDRRTRALGGLVWELGPGLHQENALVLSPAGDRSRLQRARQIISQAPQIANWEFHYAKAVRGWRPRFTIQGPDGEQVEIDATAWRYIFLRYPDGAFGVEVEVHGLKLPEKYRRWAAEILLDGLLGEAKRLLVIDEVSTVDRFDGRAKRAARSIRTIVNDDALEARMRSTPS